VKAVFYVNGLLGERYPDLMNAIVAEGHSVAAHGWAMNIFPAYQTRDEEAASLERTVGALETATGQKVLGYVSPRATFSESTSELLVKSGVIWTCDVFDQDVPYVTQTKHGPLVSIPFSLEVNDVPLHVKHGNETGVFVRALDTILDGWSEIANKPACLDITAHAHVFGRPPGIIAMKRAIRRVQQAKHAWLTTHAQIAKIYAVAG
jgi:peptidoglycan/xylan/chitin deacetylase (PgdA/CDA1 family)